MFKMVECSNGFAARASAGMSVQRCWGRGLQRCGSVRSGKGLRHLRQLVSERWACSSRGFAGVWKSAE